MCVSRLEWVKLVVSFFRAIPFHVLVLVCFRSEYDMERGEN